MSTGRHYAVLGLIVLAAACATSPASTAGSPAPVADAGAAGAPTSENVIAVTVRNNRSDGGLTTIYIQPVSGVRTNLGTVDIGETKNFSYNIDLQNRQVVLTAITAMGQQIQSERITIPRGAGLNWDLQINSIRIRR